MKRRTKAKIFNMLMAGTTGVLILLFMLSYLDSGAPPSLTADQDKKPQVKFYITQANSREFDDQGLLDFTLNSDSVRHDPRNGSARLSNPHLEVFRDGNLQWITDAQLGIVSQHGNQVKLRQRVVVRSADEQSIMTTPTLIIYPEKKLAKTEQPVTLRNPHGFTRSIGLTADLNQKRIDLHQQVRGQYQGILFEDEQ